MKSYYRLMLGKGSIHAEECHTEGFVGVGFDIFKNNLMGDLSDELRAFNNKFIPICLKMLPHASKIGAGLICGAVWTVCKGMARGDILLCPDGSRRYRIAEITGDYNYAPGTPLAHRRAVKWFDKAIQRDDMSVELSKSTGSPGTVPNITKHSKEIERLIGGPTSPTLISTDETIEDPTVFALEKHLEEFLVNNWKKTALGKNYDIYKEDGELAGQQYPSDTGPIDILAISKDKKTLLVVELKKGRASDSVVGQIQRYMGYVRDVLAEPHQAVKGVIIALEDDLRIRRALRVTQGIEFYRYEVNFTLRKESL